MPEQTWLTLDQIASTLRLPTSYIKELTNQGFLVCIGKLDKRRWLDPTPEYAERLRMAAVMQGKVVFIPPDLNEIALLTLREISVIMGWTLAYARHYMSNNPKVPRVKINCKLSLYSIATVRDLLWRRQKRKLGARRSPFLIKEIIDLFQKKYTEETANTPTDAQFLEDEIIQRKLEAIVRKADRQSAKQDFAQKVELARRVVQILDWSMSSAPEAKISQESLPLDQQ